MGIDSQMERKLEGFRADFHALRHEIGKVIVGQEDVVEGALTALVAGGHVAGGGRVLEKRPRRCRQITTLCRTARPRLHRGGAGWLGLLRGGITWRGTL